MGKVKVFVSDKIPGRIYKEIPKILKENISKTDFILLDATFYKQKWRDMIYKLAGNEKIFMVYTYCALKTCLERNRNRKAAIPERAVYMMYRQIGEPEADISVNTDRVKPEQAAGKILKKIKTYNI